MIGTKKKAQDFRKVGIAEARKRLPDLTASVEEDVSEAVELCRRDAPAALLVSHARFARLVRLLSLKHPEKDRQKHLLAWFVTDQWLGSAPSHLREPQIEELRQLPREALVALFMSSPDHLSPEVAKRGADPVAIARLRKRRALARAIEEAEREQLYDIAEHATSEVDLDPTGPNRRPGRREQGE